MLVPIKNEFRKKKILKERYLSKTKCSNLLAKNKFSTLIVYLNDSNITVVIKLSVESNITGKYQLKNNLGQREYLKHNYKAK